MELIYIVLGLAMFASQIIAAVIMFGGGKNISKGWRTAIGIGLIIMLFSVIGLTS